MEGQAQATAPSTSDSTLQGAPALRGNNKYELNAEVMADIAKLSAKDESTPDLNQAVSEGQAEAAESDGDDSIEGIDLEALGLEKKPDENTTAEETPATDTSGIEIVVDGEKKLVSMNEAKEMLQKQFDYTKKTMALSEEKKAFEQEKLQVENDIKQFLEVNESELSIKRQYDAFFEHLERSNPEYFNDLKTMATNYHAQYDNPFIRGQLASFKQELNDVKSLREELSSRKIVEQFDRELAEFKGAYQNTWDKIGFKLDDAGLKELKAKWAGMSVHGATVKQVFQALYGDKLLALAQSKLAVGKTKAQSVKKAPTFGSVRPSSNPVSEGTGNKIPRGSAAYAALAQEWAAGRLK